MNGAVTRAEGGRGWLARHRFLLLRRFSQIAVVGLFLLGPWLDLWLIKGNMSASLLFDRLPLTDPLILLQSLLAGVTEPHGSAWLGAAIVLAFYLLVGGRVFCSWVCPVNWITDSASWLRRKLGLRGGAQLGRATRFWMLGMVLALPLLTGAIVWELVNPVSVAFRGLIFGMGGAWLLLLGVFLLDLLLVRDGWCGHLCPMGAFYGLLGGASLVRVSAYARERCDDCMDCFTVCPEPRVIRPALKDQAMSPVILDGSCTNCGRCIDVCDKQVFRITGRFDRRLAEIDSSPAD